MPGHNATEWIGSYVSCKDTHVLKQTVQGARHIRCIVLRSSTDGRWLLQGKSGKSGVARFVQYGDCIGTLLPPSDRAYTSPCRTSNAARGRRLAAHALFDAAYQRISSGRTSAVSPKLSRSDLVQWGVVFHISDGRFPIDGSPSFCPMFARRRGKETSVVAERRF